MLTHLPVYRDLPEPWRGRPSFRRTRRWAQAVLFAARHNARQNRQASSVCFYPMRPGPGAMLSVILARLGVRISHDPSGANLTLAWETGTWLDERACRRLPAGALNRHCTDITKTRVDRVWGEICGYSIVVDPLVTTGPVVEKPNQNGRHGGRVIDGPIRIRRPGMSISD